MHTCPNCGHVTTDTRAPLTQRQREVLTYIEDSIAARGIAPTHREIATDLKLASLSTVNEHLTTLERKGYLVRSYNSERGIALAGSST